MRKLIVDLIRQPWVQFLVCGALLGVGLQWFSDDRSPDDETVVRITATEVARLDAGWRARWNRAPTAQELDGLIQAQVREIVLYREATALGLDRDDVMVRRVLVQKLERIAQDLIELSLSPTEQDLQQYYAEYAERYRPPPLITFTQVFVDPDLRGDQAIEDAESLVAELQASGSGADGAERYGDPLMLQSYYPEKDAQRIGSLFAQGFADVIFELAPNEWHGPVLSGYGLHAVYVHELADFPVPPLDEIRDEVTQDWVDENRQMITDRYFADMLARYDVTVEGQPGADQPEPQATPGS